MFDLGAPGPGLRLFVGPGREPRLDCRQAPTEDRAALFDGGAPHFEVLAQLGGLHAQALVFAPAAAHLGRRPLAFGDLRAQRREQLGELGGLGL